MAKSVIGHFSNREEANRAVARLVELGLIDNGAANIIDHSLAMTGERGAREESFGEKISHTLRRLFGADESSRDRDYYAESVRRGDVLVTVDVARDEDADRVADELEAQGSVDTDRRAEYLRSSGFERFDERTATPYTQDQMQGYRRDYADWESRSRGAADESTVIPVVEEEVKIGKRQVARRGVRIVSHVTERPVEESVALREETVEVERRPTDRPLGKGEAMQAFQEGAIELTERAEEPVVSKEAKVVEEVAVKKRVDQHEEKVRETVRRQDVEIQETSGDIDRTTPPSS